MHFGNRDDGDNADRYGSSQTNVEFIHPKLREEMPNNGEGGDPENPWVWLTSYSRIPVKIIDVENSMKTYRILLAILLYI